MTLCSWGKVVCFMAAPMYVVLSPELFAKNPLAELCNLPKLRLAQQHKLNGFVPVDRMTTLLRSAHLDVASAVDLMQQLRLCFEIRHGTMREYVFPEMLPGGRPEEAIWSTVCPTNESEAVHVLVLNVLPPELLAALMCEFHRDAHVPLLWRNSCLFGSRTSAFLLLVEVVDDVLYCPDESLEYTVVIQSGLRFTLRDHSVDLQGTGLLTRMLKWVANYVAPVTGNYHGITCCELVRSSRCQCYIPILLCNKVVDGIVPEVRCLVHSVSLGPSDIVDICGDERTAVTVRRESTIVEAPGSAWSANIMVPSDNALVLALGASPGGRYAVDVCREFTDARENVLLAFDPHLPQWAAEEAFRREVSVSIDAFARLLGRWRARVLHISAHATEGTLHFVKGGRQQLVSIALVIDLLLAYRRKSLPLLVVLNGCATAEMARRIHQDTGVPFVIGTTAEINDNIAILFTKQFYASLAQGNSICVAFDAARAFCRDESHKIGATADYILEPENAAENVVVCGCIRLRGSWQRCSQCVVRGDVQLASDM